MKHEAAMIAAALALAAAAGAPEQLSERLQARAGETCIVCDQAVREGDPAYLYGGQRVAVCPEDEPRFLADPAGYVARLRPNNIVMNPEPSGDGRFWLWMGLFALNGLLFGALAAQAAARKGRSMAAYFLAGFIFSLPGYLYSATRPVREGAPRIPPGEWKFHTTREPEPCPECGHPNHPTADRCTGCGATLSPRVRPETQRSDAR